ncbi:hypothetical protein O9993_18725 [Vibrio lentus]|nr:hypothetical protein [Vibrio lentus]
MTEVGGQHCFNEDEQQCFDAGPGSGASKRQLWFRTFTRQDYIDILLYARHRSVIPGLECARSARERRHNVDGSSLPKYMDLGDVGEKAEQYRLLDPQDRSGMTTVQFIIVKLYQPCLESSTQFVNKVITDSRAW